MKDIVFAHPVTTYDSYTDYRKLVQVSGFETCNQDQMDVNRDCYYICSPFNGDIEAAVRARPKKDRKCKIVMWFLERPGNEDFRKWTADKLELMDEIWFSDRAMYGKVKDMPGARFIPCGSDEAIGTREHKVNTYDFCHMSYIYGRRDILHQFGARIGPNGWGEERHKTLCGSRFMLNMHQDNNLFHEPLRFALCAAYAIPMLSEDNYDPFPYEPGRDLFQCGLGDLVMWTSTILKKDYGEYRDMGNRMWEKACKQFRFSDNVKKMVS